MVDGAALLMACFHAARQRRPAVPPWRATRLDGGAHYYDAYETADGEYVSVGSIEPQFYAELRRLAGLDGAGVGRPARPPPVAGPQGRSSTAVFRTKTRAEWCELMDGSDVCFAPVLTIPEAYEHPHNIARQSFVEVAGIRQPAPAPRFSRTPGSIDGPAAYPGQHSDEVLARFGFADAEIAAPAGAGALR